MREIMDLGEIRMDFFYRALGKDFNVYGDLLELLTISVNDFPPGLSEHIFHLAHFSQNIVELKETMLFAFISLILAKKNYFTERILTSDYEPEFYLDMLQNFYVEDGNDAIGIGFIEGFTFIPFFCEDDYFERNSHDDSVGIATLVAWPNPSKEGKVKFDYLGDPRGIAVEIREALKNETSHNGKNFFILEPLLNRVIQPKMIELKKEIEKELPNWQVVSPEEFAAIFLADEKEVVLDDFSQNVKRVRNKIEKAYPFLAYRTEIKRISRGREDILTAVHESQTTSLTRDTIDNIVRRATRGVEALLYAIYRRVSNRDVSNLTFGDLLDRVRRYIEDDYGEDMFVDLQYLNMMRNNESHPNYTDPESFEMFKVVKRAELFLRLFDEKMMLQ